MGDMDETLARGGPEAVRARIDAAVPLQPQAPANYSLPEVAPDVPAYLNDIPPASEDDLMQDVRSIFPDTNKNGDPLNTVANARHAMKLLGIECSYDIFHDKLLVGGYVIGEYVGELSDHACLILRMLIEKEYGFDPGREKMFDACVQLCLEGRFDPILGLPQRYSSGMVSRASILG